GNSIGWASLDGMTSQAMTVGPGLWDLTAGPDGNVWFTDKDNSEVGRFTPGGAITFFAPPTANSKPGGITVGADGNIWFTETASGQLGKVDLQLLRSPVVTLTASPHTTYSYDSVVLTAKVAPVVTGYGTPFGSVTFYRQVVPGDLARPFPADSIS